MDEKKDENPEIYLNAFAIELSGGRWCYQLFADRYKAEAFAEGLLDPKGDANWEKLRRKHKAKIVKVVVRKEKW